MKKILCLLSAIILFSAGFYGCGTAVPDIAESTVITESTTIETTTETITKNVITTTEPKEESTAVSQQSISSSAGKMVTSTTKSTESKTTEKPTEKEKTIAVTKKETTNEAEKTVAYSCGCKNHHCQSKEDHEFTVYLENTGCDICGSHSCPSFYALDEWGQQCFDIEKCPQYSKKKDPCKYCQVCGKKCGTGDNGTCVRFTVDTECPECGKLVKTKTCHSH